MNPSRTPSAACYRFSLTSGTLCRFAAGSSPPRGRHPTPLRHHAGTALRAPLSKAAWPISRDQAQAPTAFGIAAFKMCSDAGRGSRRRDLHPKGDVCAGHKLASDIRWLYLLLAACAPVHAPLTRGHRLPPGTSRRPARRGARGVPGHSVRAVPAGWVWCGWGTAGSVFFGLPMSWARRKSACARASKRFDLFGCGSAGRTWPLNSPRESKQTRASSTKQSRKLTR